MCDLRIPSPKSLIGDPSVHDLEQVFDTNTEPPGFVVAGLVAHDHPGLKRCCVRCTRADGLEGKQATATTNESKKHEATRCRLNSTGIFQIQPCSILKQAINPPGNNSVPSCTPNIRFERRWVNTCHTGFAKRLKDTNTLVLAVDFFYARQM